MTGISCPDILAWKSPARHPARRLCRSIAGVRDKQYRDMERETETRMPAQRYVDILTSRIRRPRSRALPCPTRASDWTSGARGRTISGNSERSCNSDLTIPVYPQKCLIFTTDRVADRHLVTEIKWIYERIMASKRPWSIGCCICKVWIFDSVFMISV